MPTKHAKLSASSSKRWLNCPGSVRASALYPSTSSIYADEGTLAHALAEELINDDYSEYSAESELKVNAFYAEHPELGGSFDEMLREIGEYVEWVKEEFADECNVDASTELMTEQRVDFSKYVPGGFGTSDVVIIRDGRLHIIDLKYGKGVPVDAEENPQLRLYALGAIEALDLAYEIKDIVMTIYQPRLDHVSSDSISRYALEEWGEKVVKPGAKEALSKTAHFEAGDWCQFCPHRAACKERAKAFYEMEEYKDSISLNNDDYARILAAADGVAKFIEDVQANALSTVLNGGEIPGWKVVEGRSNKKFTGSEAEIIEHAGRAGYDRALLYETKMLSLSAIEKLLGKKNFAEYMSDIVEKPQGKPTLVPESDKRPAIVNNSAEDDFADEFLN